MALEGGGGWGWPGRLTSYSWESLRLSLAFSRSVCSAMSVIGMGGWLSMPAESRAAVWRSPGSQQARAGSLWCESAMGERRLEGGGRAGLSRKDSRPPPQPWSIPVPNPAGGWRGGGWDSPGGIKLPVPGGEKQTRGRDGAKQLAWPLEMGGQGESPCWAERPCGPLPWGLKGEVSQGAVCVALTPCDPPYPL